MDEERIGPFRIERRLGSGGMGVVFLAFDERLRRRVAIKSINPRRDVSSELRGRLVREARAAAALSHPSIAQVYDILSEEGRDFIVMEYVEGRLLATLLADAPLELGRALDLGHQIAEGLAAAHAHGIIHRDLKAENVVVTPDGRVKILDFGVAKCLDPELGAERLTDDGVVMGTSRAMSPEQARGREVDHRSDLFALGSLLYEMTTGHHPFQGATPLDTMRRVVEAQPERIERLRPELPEELSLVIEGLLEKERGRRPSSAHEVAAALAELGGLSRSGGRETSLSQLTLTLRRRRVARRWRTTVIAVVTVLVLAGVLAGWWRLSRPRPPLVIAVLAPQLAEGADPERAPLVADALRMALLNGIARREGLVAPDTSEVDPVDGPPRAVARAVAADAVLASEVADCRLVCRLTLRRLDAEGHALWFAGPVEVAADDLLLVAGAVDAKLTSAFPHHRPARGAFVSEGRPEDLEAVLRIRRELDQPHEGVRFDELLDRLEAIAESSPRLLEARVAAVDAAGYLYQATGNASFLERGQEAVTAGERLAPDDLGLLRGGFKIALIGGQLERAEELLTRLEALAPESPATLAARARLARRRGRSAEAVALYRRVVVIRPSWRYLYFLAAAELEGGEVEAARRDLERGLERAPGNSYLLAKLAQLELANGDPRQAATLYTRLAEAYPDAAHYRSNLGVARLLASDYSGAAEAFKAALDLAPDSAASHLNLADALALSSGQALAARHHYQAALAALDRLDDPSSAYALQVRAQCLAHLGRAREATEAAQAAVRAAPDDMESRYAAALVAALAGDHTSALVSAERALELGMSPVWFGLPWFDELRTDPELAARLAAPTPRPAS